MAVSDTQESNGGGGVNEQKRSEVLAFFWFIVSAMTLLSLLSYTPNDIPFEVSLPNVPPHNFAGLAGAYGAWLLVLFFGKTSYFLVPIFLFWAVAKWAGKKGQKLWLKIFSTVMFLASACALFSLVGEATEINKFQAGGLVGFFVSGLLWKLFGNAAFFVSLSLFLLSILLATELLLLQMTVALFKKLKSRFEAPPPQASLSKAVSLLTTAKFPDIEESIKPIPVKPQIKLSTSKPETSKPAEPPETPTGDYKLPSMDLLQSSPALNHGKMKMDLELSSRVLENTLRDFSIEAKVVEVEQGPTITRYELQPAAGVKVQRITSLENDIALAMRATSIRIVAPIPGKSRVGIEVPNSSLATVSIKEVLSSSEFQMEASKIAVAIGKDTAGAPLVSNLADMPHLLIAGATNTGKSVCINSVIISILYRSTPDEVKFLIIDPKMVELHFYNDLPHLICPVVTDKTKVPGALAWLVSEMERRYQLFSKIGAKNILAFNEKVQTKERVPYIVVVIDELADLILSSQQEVENAITRLAQLARAVGIHMILATQRPSVDVITGVIKANFPARIAFQVASKVDSRTILDENGADKLLGRGDFLWMDPRKPKLVRGQGALVQDLEIEKITQFIKSQRRPVYHEAVIQSQEKKQAFGDFKRDEIYEEAKRIVLETGQASVSMVQRRLGVGYTRAARLIDMMEEDRVVGPYRGAKPREILVERPHKNEAEEEANA